MARTTLQVGPGSDDEMCGPTVTVKPSSDDGISVEVSTAVPLGTVHGGVWPNANTDPACFGWTCPACDSWRTFYQSPEQAYAALRVHQRHYCEARKDGGVSDSDLEASARRIDGLRSAADLERRSLRPLRTPLFDDVDGQS